MSEAAVIDIAHLTAALRYAAKGWHVFPVHHWTPAGCSCLSECGRPAKHPIVAKGFHAATTDEEQIRAWWSKHPQANIGIAVAKSRLVVVDVDPRNQGDESFVELEQENGSLPATLTTLTGGGGQHYIFTLPEGAPRPKSRVLKAGLELKGDSGYIVAPPSSHVSGRNYCFDSGQPEDPVPAPFWLVDAPRVRVYDKAGRPPIEGIMGAAFVAAGMAGKLLAHDRMSVRCPWENEHSQGSAFDTSTVVFGPVGKSNRGHWHCSHSHCSKRTQEEVLKALPSEAIEVAKQKVPKADRVVGIMLQEEWEKSLRRNAQGVVSKDAGNLALMLQNCEEWKGAIGYDESLDRILWLKDPPRCLGLPAPGVKGEGLTDDAYIYAQHWFVMHRQVSFTKEVVQDVLVSVARQNTFNSLIRDIDSVAWDGVDRLAGWLHHYCGAKETAYTRTVGRLWLIGAVARAQMPGCQMDTVLVMEGKQGAGKSTAFRILGGAWYTAGLPRLDDKDAKAHAHQAWMHEIEELNAIYGVEASAIKGYITALKDYYRPPYGRHYVTRARRCIFGASTNEQEWNHDSTGGRRWWPVRISTVKRDELFKDRGQLLAEASHRFHKGEKWYTEGDLESAPLEAEQAERQYSDPWDSRLTSGLNGMSPGDMLSQLGVSPDKQTPLMARRLCSRLRALGWERRQEGRVWRWYDGSSLPGEPENPYT